MKKELETLEQLLYLISLEEVRIKDTRIFILNLSKILYSDKLYNRLEIQENALKRLKIRYNKQAYNLKLFKI